MTEAPLVDLCGVIEQHFEGRLKAQLADSRALIEAEYPGEWAAVADAVPRRQREYLWGRRLLRQLAAQWHIPLGEVVSDDNKAPLLPRSLVASISHHDQQVIALAAPTNHYIAIGVDIERDQAMMPRLKQQLFTDFEKEQCQEWSQPSDPYRLLFSAKESLYKCFYYLTAVKLSFCDVSLNFDNDQTFSVRPERDLAVDGSVFAILRGQVWIQDTHIVSVFVATNLSK